MKLSSSPLIASLVEEEETSDGALSSGDALFLGLNIALTNSVNPCAFFFFLTRPHACLSPVLYSRVFSTMLYLTRGKTNAERGKMESLYWNRCLFSPECS